MINNKQLVNYARGQIGRGYWYACFGQVATEKLYELKLKEWPNMIGKWPKSSYMNQLGQKVHDCSGLIKGAVYCNGEVNGLPKYDASIDWSADDMIKKCTESGDFANIPEVVGLMVWKKGHAGIFTGVFQNAKPVVIEAKGHNYGVVEGTSTKWEKWGRLPFIKYEEDPKPEPAKKYYCRPIVPVLYQGDKGDDVKRLQFCLNLKGYELTIDGSYGPKTAEAVKDLQTKNKIKPFYTVGVKTWRILLN